MEDLNEMIEEAKQMKEEDKVFEWCNSCRKYTYHFKTCDVIRRCEICGHGQWTESDDDGILPSLKADDDDDEEEWKIEEIDIELLTELLTMKCIKTKKEA